MHGSCALFLAARLVILALIKEKVSDQGFIHDDNGSLPIHIVIGNQKAHFIVNLLLKEYPESAGLPDSQGRLPLHIAAEKGFWDSLQALVVAVPRSLEVPCPKTGLYPFQLATVPSGSKCCCPSGSLEAVSFTYSLLRELIALKQSNHQLSKTSHSWVTQCTSRFC